MLNRRTFLVFSSVLGGSAAGAFGRGAFVAPPAVAVGAIHMDKPYLDFTGKVASYRPPDGLRGGQAVSELDEFQFRSAHFYV